MAHLPAFVKGIWAPTYETSAGGPPYPQGNTRIACPPPFSPDATAAPPRRAPSGDATGRPRGYACVWTWPAEQGDRRVPVPPGGASLPAAAAPVFAAAVASGKWGGSWHLDVELAPGGERNLTISLYIVDYQRWGLSMVIKALDLGSLEVVAPMALLSAEDTAGGVYVRYSYHAGT